MDSIITLYIVQLCVLINSYIYKLYTDTMSELKKMKGMYTKDAKVGRQFMTMAMGFGHMPSICHGKWSLWGKQGTKYTTQMVHCSTHRGL